ncbi:serine hydrolase domain-containing protein [Hazenella coriacea]|uniref:CubicO group peptidase (Beta-lactamase class C family) n=1 Tax=Hazenella coriacea TaxID=1179467 RepID=A0A4R3LHM1_9BACL|nr:serine hydrolase [Hazenella coriacea]TCS97016.1 CubicO group peptidase (beta-lactamase class C family) [Hazenella coriacea]
MEAIQIEKIVKEHCENFPFSGAILVQNDEHTIFEQGYGYANRSEQIPNTPHTRFGMASGCKIFTSVAICQLVEKGLLTFDTYIKDCLDISFQNFDPNITIHHLLTHTSGIPDYFDEEVMDDFEELWKEVPMYSIRCPKDFLPMFQSDRMKFKPGSEFSYSNSGFILLGLIVEKMTGKSFPKYVEENIFRVCDMNDSGYFRMDQLPERTALGYIDSEDGSSWRTNIYSVPVVGGPDGGAFTTVHDLAKFWNALLNTKLLNKEYTDQLLTPHIHNDGDFYYGYGVWILKRNNEVFKCFISGSDPGVGLQSSVFIKSRIQSHIVANNDSKPGMIGREINGLL